MSGYADCLLCGQGSETFGVHKQSCRHYRPLPDWLSRLPHAKQCRCEICTAKAEGRTPEGGSNG